MVSSCFSAEVHNKKWKLLLVFLQLYKELIAISREIDLFRIKNLIASITFEQRVTIEWLRVNKKCAIFLNYASYLFTIWGGSEVIVNTTVRRVFSVYILNSACLYGQHEVFYNAPSFSPPTFLGRSKYKMHKSKLLNATLPVFFVSLQPKLSKIRKLWYAVFLYSCISNLFKLTLNEPWLITFYNFIAKVIIFVK
jgi:hypothetical protein